MEDLLKSSWCITDKHYMLCKLPKLRIQNSQTSLIHWFKWGTGWRCWAVRLHTETCLQGEHLAGRRNAVFSPQARKGHQDLTQTVVGIQLGPQWPCSVTPAVPTPPVYPGYPSSHCVSSAHHSHETLLPGTAHYLVFAVTPCEGENQNAYHADGKVYPWSQSRTDTGMTTLNF